MKEHGYLQPSEVIPWKKYIQGTPFRVFIFMRAQTRFGRPDVLYFIQNKFYCA